MGHQSGSPTGASTPLERKLCQVGGLNQNYVSASGTQYHIQIEDCGPVQDRVTETEVRRVNMIIYANYGEPNARIIYGHDYDYQDVRTKEYNLFVKQRIQELASQARAIIEEREQRQVLRIKCLIREYYFTKREDVKREFEQANAHFPFLFSRAWMELKSERAGRPEAAGAAAVQAPTAPSPEPEGIPVDVVYPLDAELRERVIEIERVILSLAEGIRQLRARGAADDILLQTCRKLVARAKETLTGREPSEFTGRRLDMTRQSLLTTWKQVQSRLKGH